MRTTQREGCVVFLCVPYRAVRSIVSNAVFVQTYNRYLPSLESELTDVLAGFSCPFRLEPSPVQPSSAPPAQKVLCCLLYPSERGSAVRCGHVVRDIWSTRPWRPWSLSMSIAVSCTYMCRWTGVRLQDKQVRTSIDYRASLANIFLSH